MIRFRALAIAAGYPDANDCDVLRKDAAFKMAVGRLPETGADLCSQPTMTRLENLPGPVAHSVGRGSHQPLIAAFELNWRRAPAFHRIWDARARQEIAPGDVGRVRPARSTIRRSRSAMTTASKIFLPAAARMILFGEDYAERLLSPASTSRYSAIAPCGVSALTTRASFWFCDCLRGTPAAASWPWAVINAAARCAAIVACSKSVTTTLPRRRQERPFDGHIGRRRPNRERP